MREIKFRGYAVEEMVNSQWLEGFGVYEIKLAEHYVKEVGRDSDWVLYTYSGNYRVDPKSIGQYTGLKDKNGKEIYEGDIVKFKHLKDYSGELQVVSMDRWFWATDEYAFFEIAERKYDFEVIGNVYEDGDLLNDCKITKTDSI